MNLVGSKGGSGIAQWIISAMPLHRVYVECFLGRGVVLNTKLPAAVNIGIERSPKVISRYWCRPAKSVSIIQGDALEQLPRLAWDKDALVYADPPYLMETRSCRRKYYDCELLTVSDHDRLLSVLTGLQCMVIISGYQSELYSRRLAGWRSDWKWTVNRRGKMVKEWIWMNYPEPVFFHDTRFVGIDFTDRQRIKRKVERWKKKFLSMPAHERGAILDSLSAVVDGPHSHERLSGPTKSQLTVSPAE